MPATTRTTSRDADGQFLAVPLAACLIDHPYASAAVGEQSGRLEHAGLSVAPRAPGIDQSLAWLCTFTGAGEQLLQLAEVYRLDEVGIEARAMGRFTVLRAAVARYGRQ